MKTVALTALIALLVLLRGGAPLTQELSTDIFPSEDEIYQALLSGDITYQQYLILAELAASGIDSSNAHLLDQIPNLTYFQLSPDSIRSALENEQLAAFAERDQPFTPKAQLAGSLSHRYYQYLEETGAAKYQTGLSLDYGGKIQFDLSFRREYSGYERVTGRTLTYKSGRRPFYEITIGTYSHRLGLGTIFGYRGKLLSLSRDIDTESWLFPDYGGHNGMAVLLSNGAWDLQTVTSIVRDDSYRMASSCALFQLTQAPLAPAFILGLNRLTNRTTDSTVSYFKYGLGLRHEAGGGYSALETCFQAGEGSSFGALIAEGRYRISNARLNYAGWSYSDGYIDLSGGSKAASIYHKDSLNDVAFEYSTKRAGQTGALLKATLPALTGVRPSMSLLYASFNPDTSNVEWLAELTHQKGRLSLSIEFLSRYKQRFDTEIVKRQTRSVVGWRSKTVYLRTYAGYSTLTGEDDYLSLFFSMRLKIRAYGQVELWSNLSQIDHHQGRIDYWYAYVENSFQAYGNLSAGVKLSHTYRRTSDDSHRSVASFDLAYSF